MKIICSVMLGFILFLTVGCSPSQENDLSGEIKIEVSRTVTEGDGKIMNITYPIIGGLRSSRALTTMNSSIENYVETQKREFINALSDSTSGSLINEDFDPTATKQITSRLSEEENGEEEETDATDENTEAAEGDDSTGENAEADSDTSKKTEPITLTMAFRITYHHNNILNIIESYEKVLGENKTYPGQQSFVFDLEKNAPITLGEIYDFESGFPEYIDKTIYNEIEKKQKVVTYEGKEGFVGISKDTNFYLDEEGRKLYIYFNALEISPEKNMLPTFEFSLSELRSYLTKDYQKRLK